MAKTRLLFVVPNNDIGGNTKFFLNLAKFLSPELYDSRFLVPWLTHFEYTRISRADGNPLIWVRYFLGQIRAEFFHRKLRWMGERLGIGQPRVLRYFANPKVDSLEWADILVFIANYQIYQVEKLGIDPKKIVLVIHHSGYHDKSQVEPQMLKPQFKIVVSSKFTAQKCNELGIKDFVICSLGVDLQLFNPDKKPELQVSKTRIGFFYYPNKRKSPELILKIIQAILAKYDDVELHIFGNGFPLKDRRITEHVRLAEEDYARAISSLSLFVYVSKLEGFGLPPLEAMACGVPVLASRVGAVPEYLQDGVGGFILPSESSEDDWCEKIDSLLINSQLMEELGLQARQRAEKWSWERTSQAYQRLFLEVQELNRSH